MRRGRGRLQRRRSCSCSAGPNGRAHPPQTSTEIPAASFQIRLGPPSKSHTFTPPRTSLYKQQLLNMCACNSHASTSSAPPTRSNSHSAPTASSDRSAPLTFPTAREGVWCRGRMARMKLWMFVWVVAVAVAVTTTTTSADEVGFGAGSTSRYVRKLAESADLPYSSPYFALPPGANPPQQVHLTQGDYDGKAVIVSYVTVKPSKPKVRFGIKKGDHPYVAQGYTTQYQFYNYTSGFIHHVLVSNLDFNTKYYYKIGTTADGPREFFFTTPPAPGPDTPYTFGAIGDLGQTFDSADTLEHYLQSYGQTVLYLGDLAYQDNYPFHYQVRYDTWSRFLERSAAYQPYIWTTGNHEIDYIPDVGEIVPFKPFNHRFPTPYWATNSTSPQWYSIRRGPATIIVVSSYSAYGKYTPQYVWLQSALKAVDRKVTPWLIVLVHSPWYNSYNYHYMEGETMRVIFEPFIVAAQADVVFAGHVHAYERSYPVSNIKYNITNGICTPQVDQSAPTYITIGDGGNIEGLAANYTEPQPSYSAFREASFGHGLLDIKNRTTAVWTWHRNQDGEAVSADSVILRNKIFG